MELGPSHGFFGLLNFFFLWCFTAGWPDYTHTNTLSLLGLNPSPLNSVTLGHAIVKYQKCTEDKLLHLMNNSK